ncbi:MAG: hypothetical protein H0X01_04620 [Nitrospira sp.]|nr:hypothetical protein [Nitrospira sp.]
MTPASILIVDDEVVVAEAIRRQLRSLGSWWLGWCLQGWKRFSWLVNTGRI